MCFVVFAMHFVNLAVALNLYQYMLNHIKCTYVKSYVKLYVKSISIYAASVQYLHCFMTKLQVWFGLVLFFNTISDY